MSDRHYPAEPADPFPKPPRSFSDDQERSIELRTGENQFDPLVEMYLEYESGNRSQGVPPTNEDDVSEWVASLHGVGVDTLAWHEGNVVGHATLVPYENIHEFTIFLRQPYRHAGIGTQLTETLLGHGQTAGIERVWLTVERTNNPAIAVFRNVGFEVCRRTEIEIEMCLQLS